MEDIHFDQIESALKSIGIQVIPSLKTSASPIQSNYGVIFSACKPCSCEK